MLLVLSCRCLLPPAVSLDSLCTSPFRLHLGNTFFHWVKLCCNVKQHFVNTCKNEWYLFCRCSPQARTVLAVVLKPTHTKTPLPCSGRFPLCKIKTYKMIYVSEHTRHINRHSKKPTFRMSHTSVTNITCYASDSKFSLKAGYDRKTETLGRAIWRQKFTDCINEHLCIIHGSKKRMFLFLIIQHGVLSLNCHAALMWLND